MRICRSTVASPKIESPTLHAKFFYRTIFNFISTILAILCLFWFSPFLRVFLLTMILIAKLVSKTDHSTSARSG